MAPLAFLGIFVSFGCLGYATYYYLAFVAPLDATYPEPVAKRLKRALYYANTDVQPQKSWDNFKQALAAADEAGMHPFSDEVLGIKLVSADMLERTNHVAEAARVLEIVRDDCLRFAEWCESQPQQQQQQQQEEEEKEGKLRRDDLQAARTRLLARSVGICLKLAELYTTADLDDDDAAERALVQGVELALREQQRRERAGIIAASSSPPRQQQQQQKDSGVGRYGAGGAWITPAELGGALEALADHYERRDKHALAAPLYLRALTLAQPPTCHTAVLMNNLAASLAQTSADGGGPATSFPSSSADHALPPPTSRAALIDNARQWTRKALQLARDGLPATDRSDECDLACAVATHNLGEFAEMDGLIAEARRTYEEAGRLSAKIGYADGVAQADQGLRRLSSAP